VHFSQGVASSFVKTIGFDRSCQWYPPLMMREGAGALRVEGHVNSSCCVIRPRGFSYTLHSLCKSARKKLRVVHFVRYYPRMLAMLSTINAPPAAEDDPPKMKREDFNLNQQDHDKAQMLSRAYGVSKSELLRLMIRAEFNSPRLQTSTPLDAVREILRRLHHIHKG
jgi:hypothetical protein